MKKKIAVLAVSFLATSSAMANIVSNGSFEERSSLALANGSWGQFSSLPGWTQENGDFFEIQVATNYQTGATGHYDGFNASYDGAHYLELNANRLGIIAQTLTTVADQLYRLSFGYSGRSGSGNNSLLNVYWGGNKLSSIVALPDSGWQTVDFVVRASGISTELRFESMGPSANPSYGSYLDGVTVYAVPEPATMGLLLAGLGMIGFVTRRQKHKKN